MDPDNFDNYGGVEHAEYCFQVNFSVRNVDYLSLVMQMGFIYSFVNRQHKKT